MVAAHADTRRLRTLTSRGWWALFAGVALCAAPWWAQHSAPMVIGVALLAALALAWLLTPRHGRAYAAAWLPSGTPRAGTISVCRLHVKTQGIGVPAEIWCRDPSAHDFRVARLAGPSQGPLRVRLRFPKRGRQVLQPVRIRCLQPFGLIETEQHIGTPGEALVLPAPARVRHELVSRLSVQIDATDQRHAHEDEPERLRAYVPGDPPRSIHWRASARARTLLVCQRRSGQGRRMALLIDTTPSPGDRQGRLHERLMSAAAGLVEHFHALGWHTSVHAVGFPGGVVDRYDHIMPALALLEAQDGDVISLAPRQVPCVLIGVLPRHEAPEHVTVLTGDALWNSMQFARRRW